MDILGKNVWEESENPPVPPEHQHVPGVSLEEDMAPTLVISSLNPMVIRK